MHICSFISVFRIIHSLPCVSGADVFTWSYTKYLPNVVYLVSSAVSAVPPVPDECGTTASHQRARRRFQKAGRLPQVPGPVEPASLLPDQVPVYFPLMGLLIGYRHQR